MPIVVRPSLTNMGSANPTVTGLTASSTVSTVDPSIGANDHYEAMLLDSALHSSESLRSQSNIDSVTNGSTPNPQFVYDATEDAAKLTISSNSSSTTHQLRPGYTLVDKNDSEICLQWDCKWDSNYASSSYLGGVETHKCFQFAAFNGATGDDRRWEMQIRYSQTDGTAVALPTMRVYNVTQRDDDGGSNVFFDGSPDDYQPGGDTAGYLGQSYGASDHLATSTDPFLIIPDKWVRFTWSMTFASSQQRLRLWAADEDNDPVLIMALPSDSSQGIRLDYDGTNGFGDGSDHFWFEYNSSQPRTGGELVSWCRNFLVFKDKTIPLGGRPIAG